MPAVLEAEEKVAISTEERTQLAKDAAQLAADLEEARESARRLAKRARHTAEDMMDEVTHGIKRHPLQSLGIAFGTGAVVGMALIGRGKHKHS